MALETAIVWGVVVVVITEGLGAFGALAFGPVSLAWGLLCGLAALVAMIGGPLRPVGFPRVSLGWTVLWPVGAVVILVVTVGMIAIVAPPNTFDSMTYHMSRVAHWTRNGSVAHYPTHITFQLSHSPWAEYAILQFQILTGGDRLANLVQWASMVGSLIGTSLIAARLGAGTRAQVATVVVAATVPMGSCRPRAPKMTTWSRSGWWASWPMSSRHSHRGLAIAWRGRAGSAPVSGWPSSPSPPPWSSPLRSSSG